MHQFFNEKFSATKTKSIVNTDISEDNQRLALWTQKRKNLANTVRTTSPTKNIFEKNHKTFLRALGRGDAERMEPLLTHSEISKEYRALALYEAAHGNQINIVTLLLTNSKFTDEDILWAKDVARMHNHNEIQLLLFKHLVTPELPKTRLKIDKTTEFLSSVRQGDISTVECLLKDAEISNEIREEGIQIAFSIISNLNKNLTITGCLKESNIQNSLESDEAKMVQVQIYADIVHVINESSYLTYQNSSKNNQ